MASASSTVATGTGNSVEGSERRGTLDRWSCHATRRRIPTPSGTYADHRHRQRPPFSHLHRRRAATTATVPNARPPNDRSHVCAPGTGRLTIVTSGIASAGQYLPVREREDERRYEGERDVPGDVPDGLDECVRHRRGDDRRARAAHLLAPPVRRPDVPDESAPDEQRRRGHQVDAPVAARGELRHGRSTREQVEPDRGDSDEFDAEEGADAGDQTPDDVGGAV